MTYVRQICALVSRHCPPTFGGIADETCYDDAMIGFKPRPDIPTFRLPNQVMPIDATPAAKCLADKAGGAYVTAETLDELADALQDTLGYKVYGRHPWTQLASS